MEAVVPDPTDYRREKNISIPIFTVSAGLVGVCLTVIGIIRVVISVRSISTAADDVLALDALLFLTACLLAYGAMRSDSAKRAYRLESVADGIFILALLLMAVACVLVAYAVV